MLRKNTENAFGSAEAGLKLAETLAAGTLEGLNSFLSASFSWASRQMNALAGTASLASPEWGKNLQDTARLIGNRGEATRLALEESLQKTRSALQSALNYTGQARSATLEALLQNIRISSVVGQSFAEIELSEIMPAFRLNQQDVAAEQVAAAWLASGKKHLALCLPGLFCDESLWEDFFPVFERADCFPLFVRFNPGDHIASNGKALLKLIEDFLAQPSVQARLKTAFNAGLAGSLSFVNNHQENQNSKLFVISYSQGGLILRSALYYGQQQKAPFSGAISHALLISSPDRGSYIEKMGLWLALILEKTPLWTTKLLAMIGNERSAAMKDLSHGIIREEDQQRSFMDRSNSQLYFGELDNIPATQLFSLVAETEQEPMLAWLGDGVVEKESLCSLSDSVYRRKANPDERVHCIMGSSHFSILQAPATASLMEKILTAS